MVVNEHLRKMSECIAKIESIEHSKQIGGHTLAKYDEQIEEARKLFDTAGNLWDGLRNTLSDQWGKTIRS